MKSTLPRTSHLAPRTSHLAPRTSLKIFINLMLGLFVYLNLTFAQAQTNTGIYLVWDGQVGCQVYAAGEPPREEKEPLFLEDIEDGKCFRVCEDSNVNFALFNVLPGSTVTWGIAGGIITNSSNSFCQVTWGENGMGSLSFQITEGSTIVSKTICFEKIVKPLARFSVVPFSNEEGDIVDACANQLMYFTNLSNTNGGTGLVSYFWDFGDGTFSSAFEPSHSYSNDGSYTVKLMVTNACGCRDVFSIKIKVGPKGFEIICPSIVCEGQTVTYSLPFDGRHYCLGNYKLVKE